MRRGQAATQVWVGLSRGAFLEFEQLGICREGRWKDRQAGAEAPARGDVEVCWWTRTRVGGIRPEDRRASHRASPRHRWDQSCGGLPEKAEGEGRHHYGPLGLLGPSSDMRVRHVGQTSGGLRSGSSGFVTRVGLGANGWASARSRAWASCLRLDGAKSP
jgi:hypothetical protein